MYKCHTCDIQPYCESGPFSTFASTSKGPRGKVTLAHEGVSTVVFAIIV